MNFFIDLDVVICTMQRWQCRLLCLNVLQELLSPLKNLVYSLCFFKRSNFCFWIWISFFSNWWSHRWAIRAKCTGLESNLHKSFCFPGELTTILTDFPYFVGTRPPDYKLNFWVRLLMNAFVFTVWLWVLGSLFFPSSLLTFSLHTLLLNSFHSGLSIHFCVFLSSSRILRSRMLSEALGAIFMVSSIINLTAIKQRENRYEQLYTSVIF